MPKVRDNLSSFYTYLYQLLQENKYLFIDKLVRLAFSLAWYISIAYILLPQEYGILLSVLSFTTALFITTDMFVPCYVKWPEEKNSIFFNHLLFTLPIYLASYALFHLYGLLQYYWFAVLSIFLDTLGDVVRAELMASENFNLLALFRSLSYGSYVVFSILLAPYLRINGVLIGVLVSKAVYLSKFKAFPKPSIKKKYYRLAFSGLGQASGKILNGIVEPGVLLKVLSPAELGSLYLNKKLFTSIANVINETIGVWIQPQITKNRKLDLKLLTVIVMLIHFSVSAFVFLFYKLGWLSKIFSKYHFSLGYMISFYLFSLFLTLSIILSLIVLYREKIKESSLIGSVPVLVWLAIILAIPNIDGIYLAYVCYGLTRFLLSLKFVQKEVFEE